MLNATEPYRHQRLAKINSEQGSSKALETQYGQAWNTARTALVLEPSSEVVPRHPMAQLDVKAECDRLERATARILKKNLDEICGRVLHEFGKPQSGICEAHLAILNDATFALRILDPDRSQPGQRRASSRSRDSSILRSDHGSRKPLPKSDAQTCDGCPRASLLMEKIVDDDVNLATKQIARIAGKYGIL